MVEMELLHISKKDMDVNVVIQLYVRVVIL
jgi:hypothetical protein